MCKKKQTTKKRDREMPRKYRREEHKPYWCVDFDERRLFLVFELRTNVNPNSNGAYRLRHSAEMKMKQTKLYTLHIRAYVRNNQLQAWELFRCTFFLCLWLAYFPPIELADYYYLVLSFLVWTVWYFNWCCMRVASIYDIVRNAD